MSKELPYFKFFPSEWITGDVTLCSMEAQGIFVNILGFYWNKNCSMSLANAKQRFSKHIAGFNQLLESAIIKVDKDDNIIINFLDEQMNEFIDVSEKRAIAGKKGGLAKAKHLPEFAKAKRSNIDKEIDIDKIKNKTPIPPLTEFLEHSKIACNKANLNFNELSFAIESKYETWVQDGWKDGNGNKIKIWKTKLNNTLPFLKPIKQQLNKHPAGRYHSGEKNYEDEVL